VLFVSKLAQYKQGKAIRGGIPICWPWFNDHPTDTDKPAHGFVRTAHWQVTGASHDTTGTTLELEFSSNDATLALWPYAFRLHYRVHVGQALDAILTIHNTGTQPFRYTGALHSYFNVGDAALIGIRGLNNSRYIDNLDEQRRKVQHGPVRVSQKMVHIHTGSTADCMIDDPVMRRAVRVAKSGSRTTIIWNPWSSQAAEMGDFDNEEYRQMVCIEAGNALDDTVAISAGQSTCLGTRISLETTDDPV